MDTVMNTHLQQSLSIFCDIKFILAEGLVKDKEAGTFVVRDSTSYRGSFGLAMKVDQTSANFTATAYPGKRLLVTVRQPDLMTPFESRAIIKKSQQF